MCCGSVEHLPNLWLDVFYVSIIWVFKKYELRPLKSFTAIQLHSYEAYAYITFMLYLSLGVPWQTGEVKNEAAAVKD